MEIVVRGASTEAGAHRIAKTIAESPLVKTALFGKDPNWGRLLMAAGRAGVPFDPSRVEARIGEYVVCANGGSVAFDRDAAHDYLTGKEIQIVLDLNTGDETATVWTCDYSYDYIKINAEIIRRKNHRSKTFPRKGEPSMTTETLQEELEKDDEIMPRLPVDFDRLYTADELFCLPPDFRCELLQGVLIEMPPSPGGEHGYLALDAFLDASLFVRQNNLGKCFTSETGFLLATNPDVVLAPDWAFVSWERLPKPIPRKHIPAAPDIVLEVRSPSDSKAEAEQKALLWLL